MTSNVCVQVICKGYVCWNCSTWFRPIGWSRSIIKWFGVDSWRGRLFLASRLRLYIPILLSVLGFYNILIPFQLLLQQLDLRFEISNSMLIEITLTRKITAFVGAGAHPPWLFIRNRCGQRCWLNSRLWALPPCLVGLFVIYATDRCFFAASTWSSLHIKTTTLV